MKREIKLNTNLAFLIIIAAVALTAVIRICGNTTQNAVYWISGGADDRIKIEDSTYLELNFDTPLGGLTGFSFEFEGNREQFGDAAFLVVAETGDDIQGKQVLHRKKVALIDQAYDYQNERFKVMIPLEGEVNQGDHIRIAIMGNAIPEKSNVYIKTSGRSGIAGAVFEINDFEQDSILSGAFYYQKRGVTIFPILRQSVVFILFVLLIKEIWEKRSREGKPAEKQSRIIHNKKILLLLPVLFVLIAGLDYVYYAGVTPRLQDMKPGKEDVAYEKGETAYMELGDGEALFREVGIEEDYLGGLKLYLKKPYDEEGIFTIELIESESQELVASAQRALYEMMQDHGGGAETEIEVEFKYDTPVKKSAGTDYLIAIYYSGEPVRLLMIDDGQNHPVITPLHCKNNFLKPLFWIFAILVVGISAVVFWCVQNRMKVEKFLFLVIVLLGILFQTVITPFAVPDEAAHIDTAYRISNRILGIEDTKMKDAILKRTCDNYTESGNRKYVNAESYRWLYEDWFHTEGNRTGQLAYASDVRANADSLFYLPAALGITLGRILGIGFLPMIFLARMANLLVCAWMIYLAERKLPFGKSVLCVIALLPITLQEIASCSYDSLIIGVSLLYISYCVFAIYSTRRLEKTDILTLLIAAVMLGMCKGGVYTPLYLLGVWALIKRGYIMFPQTKKMKAAGAVMIAGIVLLLITAVVYLLRQPIDTHSLRHMKYPLAYLVQHPIKVFRIFQNTLYGYTHDYVVQCIGMQMGYFQIAARFITPIGYALLIGATVICDERYPYVADRKEKCIFLASSILSAGAILLAFLISDTNFGNAAITGVQGRYFIPMLWLILISIRSGRIVYKKKPYRKIVTAGYIMGVCTVLQIVINALGQ